MTFVVRLGELVAQVESDSRLTATGDVLGTLRYMSPEQAQISEDQRCYPAATSSFEIGCDKKIWEIFPELP